MLHKIVVEGGRRLAGSVRPSGSKNAVLPMLAATLLAEGPCELRGVPNLSDVHLMLEILEELGVETSFVDGVVRTEVIDPSKTVAPYELVSQMRASITVLGPLLATRKRAKVATPGGCVIGIRPVDLHLKGLRAIGAEIETLGGYLEARNREMRGRPVFLGGPAGSTVTGTANVLMCAVRTPGTTIIEQAACEPEIEDLALFLREMGAQIDGVGTPRLTVTGVEHLQGVTHEIIADRIEAATYMIGAAMTEGDVTVEHCRPDHLFAVSDLLEQTGSSVDLVDDTTLRVRGTRYVKAIDVTTFAYPGFPTDVQAQMMSLLSLSDGLSVVTDTIYPDRFHHVAEYNRMGARIRKIGNTAVVQGVEFLQGAPVKATDLRAGAGLILAGLAAKGTTEVYEVQHIDRGYESIEEKFISLGGQIHREPIPLRRRRADRIDDSEPVFAPVKAA